MLAYSAIVFIVLVYSYAVFIVRTFSFMLFTVVLYSLAVFDDVELIFADQYSTGKESSSHQVTHVFTTPNADPYNSTAAMFIWYRKRYKKTKNMFDK